MRTLPLALYLIRFLQDQDFIFLGRADVSLEPLFLRRPRGPGRILAQEDRRGRDHVVILSYATC
jgi:hypothetical protein